LEESLTASIVAEEEGERELLSLASQDGHSEGEACPYCVESSRGASLSISSERGRGMDACFSHSKEARAAEYGSLCVVIQSKEGNGAERLGDSAEAAINRSTEQSGEASGLCRREASGEPCLMPWHLLGAIKAESEGEAKASSLAIGEADRP